MNYKQAIDYAFVKIEGNDIASSWKDSFVNSPLKQEESSKYLKVPKYGCLKDIKERNVKSEQKTLSKILSGRDE